MRRFHSVVATIGAIALGACAPDIQLDPGEGPGELGTEAPAQQAILDPSGARGYKIIPFPNNLLLNPKTGKVSLPASCSESPTAGALRENVLNALDGFGNFKTVIRIPLSSEPDMTSMAGLVKLYRRATAGVAADPVEVPLAIVFARQVPIDGVVPLKDGLPDCAAQALPKPVWHLLVVPGVPLVGSSTYTMTLAQGGNNVDGEEFDSAFIWRFVRQSQSPVDLDDTGAIIVNRTPLDPAKDAATLLGLDTLWKAHAAAMSYAVTATGKTREELLMVFDFNTQTTTETVDPSVAGSPGAKTLTAHKAFRLVCADSSTCIGECDMTANPNADKGLCEGIADAAIVGPTPAGAATVPVPVPITNAASLEAILSKLGSPATCTALNCAELDTLSAAEQAPAFMRKLLLGTGTNPALLLTACAQVGCDSVGAILEGQVESVNYQPNLDIPQVGFVTAWTDPVNPAPVGFNRMPVRLFIPAGDMPAGGWPLVVFGHGLGRNKDDLLFIGAQLAKAGMASAAISWVAHGSRFLGEQILSANLANTRDNLRQSVLDGLTLIRAAKACTAATCSGFEINGEKIGYLGQSLGGLIGTVLAGVSPDIKGTVINVGGAGWVDVLENNKTDAIVCPLVDALIRLKILEGELSGFPGLVDDAALCRGEWAKQDTWQSFAVVARWILDPADGANAAALLRGRPVLVQQVVGDGTVPEIAQIQLGRLLGLSEPSPAATYTGRILVDKPTLSLFQPRDDGNPARHLSYATKSCQDVCNTVAAATDGVDELTCVLFDKGSSCLPPATGCAACAVDMACVGPAFDGDVEQCRAVLTFDGNRYGHGSLLSPVKPDAASGGSASPGQAGTAQMQTDAIGFLKAAIDPPAAL